jgi:hypothetical protein
MNGYEYGALLKLQLTGDNWITYRESCFSATVSQDNEHPDSVQARELFWLPEVLTTAFFWDITQRRVVILYPYFGIIENKTDTLSRNVGKGLPQDAA